MLFVNICAQFSWNLHTCNVWKVAKKYTILHFSPLWISTLTAMNKYLFLIILLDKEPIGYYRAVPILCPSKWPLLSSVDSLGTAGWCVPNPRIHLLEILIDTRMSHVDIALIAWYRYRPLTFPAGYCVWPLTMPGEFWQSGDIPRSLWWRAMTLTVHANQYTLFI